MFAFYVYFFHLIGKGGAMAKKTAKKAPKRAKPSREAILDAAERLFASQSYADTSLRQLMQAAGVSTTAFYARFSSKDALLAGLAERFVGELTKNAARRLAEAGGMTEAFDVGVEVLLEAVEKRRPLLRLLLGESASSRALQAVLAQAYSQLAGLLGGYLQALMNKGRIPQSDAHTIGWAMVGAFKFQLERWAVFEDLNDDELKAALFASGRAMLPLVKAPRQK
jgi:AcrR family transcriptional regulator